MCSISGCVVFDKKNHTAIDKKIKIIIERATDRGRDSFGVVAFDNNKGKVFERVYKQPKRFSKNSLHELTPCFLIDISYWDCG